MAKENLETVSTEKLQRRKKFTTLVLGMMVGLLFFNIIVSTLKEGTPGLFIPVVLLVGGLPMFIGRKRIIEELERRKNG